MKIRSLFLGCLVFWSGLFCPPEGAGEGPLSDDDMLTEGTDTQPDDKLPGGRRSPIPIFFDAHDGSINSPGESGESHELSATVFPHGTTDIGDTIAQDPITTVVPTTGATTNVTTVLGGVPAQQPLSTGVIEPPTSGQMVDRVTQVLDDQNVTRETLPQVQKMVIRVLRTDPTSPLYKAMSDTLTKAQTAIKENNQSASVEGNNDLEALLTLESSCDDLRASVVGDEILLGDNTNQEIESFILALKRYVVRQILEQNHVQGITFDEFLTLPVKNTSTREKVDFSLQRSEFNRKLMKAVVRVSTAQALVQEIVTNPGRYTAQEVQDFIDFIQQQLQADQISDAQGRVYVFSTEPAYVKIFQRKLANLANKVTSYLTKLVKQLQGEIAGGKLKIIPQKVGFIPLGVAAAIAKMKLAGTNTAFVSKMEADNQKLQSLLQEKKDLLDREQSPTLSQVKSLVLEMNRLANTVAGRTWKLSSDSTELTELQQEFAQNVANVVKQAVEELQKDPYRPSFLPEPTTWWNENLTWWDALVRLFAGPKETIEFGKGQFTQVANYERITRATIKYFKQTMGEVLDGLPKSTVRKDFTKYYTDAQETLEGPLREIELIHRQESAMQALVACQGTLPIKSASAAFKVPAIYTDYESSIEMKFFLDAVFDQQNLTNPFLQFVLKDELGENSFYQKSTAFRKVLGKDMQTAIRTIIQEVIEGKVRLKDLIQDITKKPILIAFRNSWISYMTVGVSKVQFWPGELPEMVDVLAAPQYEFVEGAVSLADFRKLARYNQSIYPERFLVDIEKLCKSVDTFKLVANVFRKQISQVVDSDLAQQFFEKLQASDFDLRYQYVQQQCVDLAALLRNPENRAAYMIVSAYAQDVLANQREVLAQLQAVENQLKTADKEQLTEYKENLEYVYSLVSQDAAVLSVLESKKLSQKSIEAGLATPVFGQMDQVVMFEERGGVLSTNLDEGTVMRARDKFLDEEGMYQKSAAFRALPKVASSDQVTQSDVLNWLENLTVDTIVGLRKNTDVKTLATVEVFLKSWHDAVQEQVEKSMELLKTSPTALTQQQLSVLRSTALSHNEPELAALLYDIPGAVMVSSLLQGKQLPLSLLRPLLMSDVSEDISSLYKQLQKQLTTSA